MRRLQSATTSKTQQAAGGRVKKPVGLKHSGYRAVGEFLLITTTNVYLLVYQGRGRGGRWRGANIYSQHRMLHLPVGQAEAV